MNPIKPVFNREYWIDQFKKEVGLSDVAYDDLDQHVVNFDSPMGGLAESNLLSTKNAKDYVDEQLRITEEQYNSFEDIGDTVDLLQEQINDMLGPVNQQLVQLKQVEMKVTQSSVRYFDVVVGGMAYTVAVNTDNKPMMVTDQINHVINTSFFVEERPANYLTGFESIISYYQFANLIQSFIKQNTDLSAFEKISQNIDTVFDGIKMNGF